jgi:F0F1-type ATP synthase alpha subunit
MAVQSGLLDALPMPEVAKFRLGLRQAIDTGAAASVHQIQTQGTLDALGEAGLSEVLATYAATIVAAKPATTTKSASRSVSPMSPYASTAFASLAR